MWSAWIALLVLWSRCCQIAAVTCWDTEYEKDGRCCALCGPGQRLEKECTESDGTVCVACQSGTYQDKWNRETSCVLHHYCDENAGFQKTSEGTMRKDVGCICKDGRHCSSEQCETCVFNTLCAPGFGVTRKADKYSDTTCESCPEGTFSNITSDTEPCKEWQRCTSSQQEIRRGNASADVVCGPHQKNSAWIIIVVVLMGLSIGLGVFYFVRRKRREKKVKMTQHIEDPPERVKEEPLIPLHVPNLPEEDQDDQDITMQGLPYAQEEGKDCHMSQEEK